MMRRSEMQAPKNPFLTNGYYNPEYFCGRKQEMAVLHSAIENGRNITLIAPRRYGKTGLIHNFFQTLSGYTCIYLDMFPIQDLAGFTSALASTVVNALDSRLERIGTLVKRFFLNSRPMIEASPDGGVKMSLNIAKETAATSLEEVFRYLGSKKKNIVIALDEFQQIADFPEKNVEALLRSHIQGTPDIRFIFSGSRHHIMNEMFTSAARPFFQSTQIMDIGPIGEDEYNAFAEAFFRKRGFSFAKECFAYLYKRFDGVTWYVQAVLNRLWERETSITNNAQIDEAINELVSEREYIYADLLKSQNRTAAKLLLAIAQEKLVKSPTASEFIMKHQLNAPSSVATALKTLLYNELLYKDTQGIRVYDYLFSCWLRRLA